MKLGQTDVRVGVGLHFENTVKYKWKIKRNTGFKKKRWEKEIVGNQDSKERYNISFPA